MDRSQVNDEPAAFRYTAAIGHIVVFHVQGVDTGILIAYGIVRHESAVAIRCLVHGIRLPHSHVVCREGDGSHQAELVQVGIVVGHADDVRSVGLDCFGLHESLAGEFHQPEGLALASRLALLEWNDVPLAAVRDFLHVEGQRDVLSHFLACFLSAKIRSILVSQVAPWGILCQMVTLSDEMNSVIEIPLS